MTKEIREFLKKYKNGTLEEISASLKKDKQMVEHMLQLLVQKNIVKEIKTEMPCKSCTCSTDCNSKIYQWIA